jgi:FtsZ-binding cell division protein ZapB
MTLPRIFRRRSRRQLEAEIANLRAEAERWATEVADLEHNNNMQAAEITRLKYENDTLFEANQGLCDRLRALLQPLPGEERASVERTLN